MNVVFLGLYRYLVMPVVVVLIPFLSVFDGKIREGFRLRRKRWENLERSGRLPAIRPLWIHAASGEFEYAKAVIREFKLRFSDTPVVVTYFSPTFAQAVEKFPGVERAIALPIDLPGPCQSFLRRLNPQLLLIARTDLWPEMLEQCQRAKIPVELFSYTQKEFSNFFKLSLRRWLISKVNHIYCVAGSDRVALASATEASKIEVLGDTRYDQVAYRLSHPKDLPLELKPSPSVPCFVAGSTWEQDEKVLLSGLAEVLREGRLKLILVPHEPTEPHLQNTEALLRKFELSFARFSQGESWSDKHVLLVDQIGILAELYLWGDFAFVGGSFGRGAHSVMEALGAGCYTFVGPKHSNNREAMEFKELNLSGHVGVDEFKTSEELNDKIAALVRDPLGLQNFRQELTAQFSSRLGVSVKLVARIAGHFN